MNRPPLDLSKVRVFPLSERRNLIRVEDTLLDPAAAPPPVDPANLTGIAAVAARIRAARERGASVMLTYGAHLLRNGAVLILDALMERGWLTHLATNGAGTIHDWEVSFLGRTEESVRKNVATIHDWEFAWLGRSSESVRDGVARGCFGTWDETGRCINLALLAAGVSGDGYGRAMGRFIAEDGVLLPEPAALVEAIRREPEHPLTAARAELLLAMRAHNLSAGHYHMRHQWKQASILASAYRRGVPVTVHPGIGYDIIATHPMFNGAAIGRTAQRDFATFAAAVEGLDGGVLLSVGSAIMGPQVFEKTISCVNNLRVHAGRPVVSGHTICVVDLQDGGRWDWSAGEPPKTNPAYYLRFCKSYSRMGGQMRYLQCDNLAFVHHLYHQLAATP